MSNLLNKHEIQAIAEQVNFPNTAFINGKFGAAKSGKTFATINPATGETLTRIAACDAVDVDLAVAKGRKAFNSGIWSKMHPTDRKSTMIKLAKLLTRHCNELAVLESLESGKPIKDCLEIDVPETIHFCDQLGAFSTKFRY